MALLVVIGAWILLAPVVGLSLGVAIRRADCLEQPEPVDGAAAPRAAEPAAAALAEPVAASV